MKTSSEIIVPLSKGKIGLIVLGSVAFVTACVWIWSIADSQTRRDPGFLKVIAIVGALFFGLCGIYGLWKMFDSRPGLIIDDVGIVDNSSGVAAGRIPWDEIEAITVSAIAGQRYLTVMVTDQQKYIERGSFIQKRLNASSSKMNGSPINISSNSLKINFDDLVGLLTSELIKQKTVGQPLRPPQV